ncbi:hypothetical protein Ciccas_006653 [Cichlidogyrus casuarinus]|uniref:Cation-dependent mannose-6-phosphate receptor n=1 Tax=Cichlidogyrus casuarinus TaxID=1844966 RepID=A0ABD2Q573_9PLAT
MCGNLQYVCLDGSELDPKHIKSSVFAYNRTDGKSVGQIVIREKGLETDRMPPAEKKADGTDFVQCSGKTPDRQTGLVYTLDGHGHDCKVTSQDRDRDLNKIRMQKCSATNSSYAQEQPKGHEGLGRYMNKILFTIVFLLIFGTIGTFVVRNWNSIDLFDRRKKKKKVSLPAMEDPLMPESQDQALII